MTGCRQSVEPHIGTPDFAAARTAQPLYSRASFSMNRRNFDFNFREAPISADAALQQQQPAKGALTALSSLDLESLLPASKRSFRS